MRAPLRLLAFLWLSFLLAEPARAVTLADLDAILAKAPNLAAFMRSMRSCQAASGTPVSRTTAVSSTVVPRS